MEVFDLDGLMKVQYTENNMDNEYSFRFLIGNVFMDIGLVEMYDHYRLFDYIKQELESHIKTYYSMMDCGEDISVQDSESLRLIEAFNEDIESVIKESYDDEWSFNKKLGFLYATAKRVNDKEFRVWIEERVSRETLLVMNP